MKALLLSCAALSASLFVTSPSALAAKANSICDRLEQTLAHLNEARLKGPEVDLVALRRRISELASRLA